MAENKPILAAPGDIFLSNEGIAEIVQRVMTADPVMALGIAKMLEKAAKDIIGETKSDVLGQIEAAVADSDGNTVEVGHAQFTYRNGKTSHIYTDLPLWDAANEVLSSRRVAAETIRDRLLNESDEYQKALFDVQRAEQALQIVEKEARANSQSTIVTQAATVAVKFLKS